MVLLSELTFDGSDSQVRRDHPVFVDEVYFWVLAPHYVFTVAELGLNGEVVLFIEIPIGLQSFSYVLEGLPLYDILNVNGRIQPRETFAKTSILVQEERTVIRFVCDNSLLREAQNTILLSHPFQVMGKLL